MQHRPLQRERLAGRESPCLGHLLLFLLALIAGKDAGVVVHGIILNPANDSQPHLKIGPTRKEIHLTGRPPRCSIWEISDAPFIRQPGFRQQHGYVLLYVYVYTRAAGAEQFFLDF